MKWVFYNLAWAAVFPLLLPAFLLRMFRRGGYAARMCDRFALYPSEILDKLPVDPSKGRHGVYEPGPFVWIHAVSVGEVQVAGQFMRAWREVEPSVRFCFSTTSSTGWKMAEREIADGDVLVYNPLDFPNYVKSALKTVKPRAIILTESEIWPNFIRCAKRFGVPVFLINARVSDRSAPRYRAARWFFGDVFAAITRIFVQSDLDRERLLAAGASSERVEVTGSFKFDVAHRNEAKEAELTRWIFPGGRPDDARVLLGGSTWPGEDEVMLEAYRRLLDRKRTADRPVLVIAPRHFEKADAVEANVRKAGFECVRRSRARCPASGARSQAPVVYLADTTGELMGLYGIADSVFVGKTLCAHGGQNMIEPCLCGKPTYVGPNTENFRPVMSDLLAFNAIVQAPDREALIGRMVADFCTDEANALGCRAAQAVSRRTGVVPRCVNAVRGAVR